MNGWVKSRETGDLRRHRAHYDVTVMANPLPELISTKIYQRDQASAIWMLFFFQIKFNTK